MTSRRGTTNGNLRGNSASRRRRKQHMLDHFGNGEWTICSTCPTILDMESMTVDCYPIARCDGGKYGVPSDMSNVRPQCQPCASRQGGLMSAERRRKRKLVEALSEAFDVPVEILGYAS